MIEHRLADRLIGYWNTIKKDDSMPDFGHFNASAIDDIWQQCVLFTVSPEAGSEPFILNFYRIGDKLRAIYGSNMVGRSFNTSQRHFQGAAVVRHVADIIINPAPLTEVGQFVNEHSKVVKYRSCLLPFGRDAKVTHVVVGLSWREY